MNIIIKINNNQVIKGELNDTETSKHLINILPVTAPANIWGEEIYFELPFSIENENPQDIVELGDLAYWPPGKAFCIFFGTTPVSIGNEIRPASEVTVIGKIRGEYQNLKSVNNQDLITIELL
jgi:hypothetical protein